MKNRKVSKKITAIIAVAAMMVSFFAINATANGTDAPASGYAAVGIVDAEAHKAEVLLGTGQQGTVIFAGEAPAAGRGCVSWPAHSTHDRRTYETAERQEWQTSPARLLGSPGFRPISS